MANRDWWEEQQASDLTFKNQQKTGNHQAYAHDPVPSSFHQHCCNRTYITIHGKGIWNMFFPATKMKKLMYLLRDSILVTWNQEALLDAWADKCLIQDNLILLGLLNGAFLTFAYICIIYIQIYEYLCTMRQGSITFVSKVQITLNECYQSQSW